MDQNDLLAMLRKKSFAKAYEAARKNPRLVNEPETGSEGASDTPFQWACRFGDKATMLELLALGGDVTKPAEEGRVPLELVADGSPYATAAQVEARTEMAAALLRAKAPLGAEVLELACTLGAGKARELVKMLIAAGAKGNFVSGGSTILHVACTYDLPEALEYGLQSGVDVDSAIDASAFDGGSTALHIAVKKRRTAMVERLVSAGARADLVDKRGASPQSLATAALRKILEGKPAAAPAPAPKRAKDPAAILEQLWKTPTNHESLSVYADWLMENGQASRGEYIALKLLERPTAAQTKRAAQLLGKDRGRWLGDARKLVSEWVDSERTPGFVASATVSVENLLEHLEVLRALGPEVVLRVTPIKTRLVTKKLAALPLGRLYGLHLYNTVGTYRMNRDWLDDTSLGILGPSLIGLRALVLAPAVQAREGEHFTPAAIEALRPVGASLEDLTLDFTDSDPPRALLEAITPAVFPKLRTLNVVGLAPELRKRLRSGWGDGVKLVFTA